MSCTTRTRMWRYSYITLLRLVFTIPKLYWQFGNLGSCAIYGFCAEAKSCCCTKGIEYNTELVLASLLDSNLPRAKRPGHSDTYTVQVDFQASIFALYINVPKSDDHHQRFLQIMDSQHKIRST